MGYFKLGKELATKGPDVFKAVKPLVKKLGAKSKQYWQNKASAARIKAVATDIESVAHKAATTMGRLGSKEKRIKWYQKAAKKKRYSDDFYKGKR
jgi:hypothetical protein